MLHVHSTYQTEVLDGTTDILHHQSKKKLFRGFLFMPFGYY